MPSKPIDVLFFTIQNTQYCGSSSDSVLFYKRKTKNVNVCSFRVVTDLLCIDCPAMTITDSGRQDVC